METPARRSWVRTARWSPGPGRLLVFAHELQQVLDVSLDLDLRIDLRDPAGLVDHERGALDAQVLLPVEVLHLVDAEQLRDRGVLVGQERERQLLFVAKMKVRF